MTQVIEVKRGYARRAAALTCVAFAGCAAVNHHECVEYPSIHGPCSWAHSAWQTLGCFVFAGASMAVLMVAAFWVAGIVSFGKRGEK